MSGGRPRSPRSPRAGGRQRAPEDRTVDQPQDTVSVESDERHFSKAGHHNQLGKDFDYRQWAAGGFRMHDWEELDEDEEADAEPELGLSPGSKEAVQLSPEDMELRPSEMVTDDADSSLFADLPYVADGPDRFDISEYRDGLYGGPAAELIGEYHPVEPVGQQSVPQPVATQAEHSAPPPELPVPPPLEPVNHMGSLVRPYARTGGRTRSDYDLAIEALVSTSERGRSVRATTRPEHRSICGLCMDAHSVAEVAAHLGIPLGVAKVLIGDLAGMGLVMIHESGMVVGDRPSMEFLERVLSGLRRL